MQDIDDGRIPSPARDPFSGDGGLGDRKEVMVLVDGDVSLDSEGRSTHVDLLPCKLVGKPEDEAKDANPFSPFGLSLSLERAEERGGETLPVAVDFGDRDDRDKGTLGFDRPNFDPTYCVPTKKHREKLAFETNSAPGTLEIEGEEEGSETTSNLNYVDRQKEARKRKAFSEPVAFGDIQMKGQKKHGADGWQVIVAESTMAADDLSSEEGHGSNEDDFDFDSEDEADVKISVTKKSVVVIAKPFNIDLMRHCIEKGKESLDLIAGKDVILCVGKTGTGKSSLIQGIAGKEFKKCSFELEMARKDVYEAEDPVPGFEIGHAKSSMTKHIKCFFRHGNTNSRFAYIDTPGFDDTEGEEVDIATSVMLNHVAMKCRSLRFVVMINYVSLLEDRGGAMRAIIKFMRHFVLDFEMHKTSFMFLFSHADEIKDVPESLEGAKKNLLNEIVMTIDGTPSGEVRNVLSFIKKSLEKGFPFVDIFHPMKTNFLSLAAFIETRQKPVKKPNSSTHCFLTLSSQVRLGGAVEKLLSEVRILLGREDVDVDRIQQIRHTFAYFDMYLDFEGVQRASRDSKELLEHYINGLQLSAESDIVKGTTSNVQFSPRNVESLKRCLLYLSVLRDDFSIQAVSDTIVRRVRAFQEFLFLEANNGFDGLYKNLYKLQVWSGFDQDMQVLYVEVTAHLNALIEDLAVELSKYEHDDLTACEWNMIHELSGNLKALKSLNENSKELRAYLPSVSNASKIYLNFIEKLQNTLVSRSIEAYSMCEVLDFCDDQSVELLVTNVRNTEGIDKLLRESSARDSCLKGSTLFDIESMIVGKFKEACSNLKDTAREIDEEGWMLPLIDYRDVVQAFSSLQGQSWKAMESIYQSVIDRIKSILKAKSGELDEMSHNALQFGLSDGNRDGKALTGFAKCQWFDGLLPPDERFVENCVAKVMSDYRRKFANSEESFRGILMWISHQSSRISETDGLIGATVELKNLLVEVVQFSKFGEYVADQELLSRTSKLHLKLHDHIRARAQMWDESVRSWTREIEKPGRDLDEVALLTENLDLILHEIEVIDRMDVEDCIKLVVFSSRKEILQAFASFRLNVNERFEANPTYDEIAVFIECVQAMASFTRTAPHLPNIDVLKEFARQRISSDAKRIEEMIEQTSEFDAIENLLDEFEKATVLDSFVSQEVSSRLRPLQSLRTIKEGEVDELIKTMIEKKSFKGIREFLLPLSESRDQIRVQRFNQSITSICDSLKDTNKQLTKALRGPLSEEKARKIAESIAVLESASDEGGSFLAQAYDTRIKANIAKQTLARKLDSLEDRMRSATERADFIVSAESNGRLVIIDNYLEGCLEQESKTKLRRAMAMYCTLKQCIPSRIDTFCTTSFVEFKGIEQALDGLKAATWKNELCFQGLDDLYSESVNLSEEKVFEVIRSVRDSAARAQCYDDAMGIIQNLKRSMEIGLGSHLSQKIRDECICLLESWREARKKQEGELSFDGCLKRKVETWATTMDTLDPSTDHWSWLTGRRATATYEKHRKNLEAEVSGRYSLGQKALTMRDFVILNDHIEFLSLVDSKLGKHVKSAYLFRQQLKEKVFESFVALCLSCQETLQAENYREFEPRFTDFRSAILYITCIFEDANAEKSFHLTNQLLFERMVNEISSLEKSIGAFDFLDTKVKVENLRIFGGFIADRFSLSARRIGNL